MCIVISCKSDTGKKHILYASVMEKLFQTDSNHEGLEQELLAGMHKARDAQQNLSCGHVVIHIDNWYHAIVCRPHSMSLLAGPMLVKPRFICLPFSSFRGLLKITHMIWWDLDAPLETCWTCHA